MKKHKGTSMIEVIIALSIISLILSMQMKNTLVFFRYTKHSYDFNKEYIDANESIEYIDSVIKSGYNIKIIKREGQSVILLKDNLYNNLEIYKNGKILVIERGGRNNVLMRNVASFNAEISGSMLFISIKSFLGGVYERCLYLN